LFSGSSRIDIFEIRRWHAEKPVAERNLKLMKTTNLTKPPGYESKSEEYFGYSRPEMLQFVPADCKRILDVGCGQGAFGELLKRTRNLEVWGIEPVAAAAAKAATKIDRVIEGGFDAEAGLPPESLDAIVFNDVLEHLMDPAGALDLSKKLLRPGGAIIASIPNIRHFPTMWELIVRREWQYRDSGILDRTHLRFFTQKSILALFADCGFNVNRISGINPHFGWTRRQLLRFKVLNGVTFNMIEDMKYLQFAVVAHRS
jgi:2-polyprenyl-3-methyl-5-hydroxy-6-metoxy-1,4-benzoquinol methylase